MSTPTDPARSAGPTAYTPVPIPVSAAPLAGESTPATGKGPSRLLLAVAAAVFVVVAAGSFLLVNSFLSPGREEKRADGMEQITREVDGPDHVVQAYLDALADGNTRGAWAIASGALLYQTDPTVAGDLTFPEPALLIDNASYQSTKALLTNPTIDSVRFNPNQTATVTASYDLGGDRVTQEFLLSQGDLPKPGDVTRWTFTEPPVGEIAITTTPGNRIVVNGVDVTSWADISGTVTLPVMVGTYACTLVNAEGTEVDAKKVVVTSTTEPVSVRLGS